MCLASTIHATISFTGLDFQLISLRVLPCPLGQRVKHPLNQIVNKDIQIGDQLLGAEVLIHITRLNAECESPDGTSCI